MVSRSALSIVFLVLSSVFSNSICHHHHGQDKTSVWMNKWIVKVKSGHHAQVIADEIGLRFLEELDGFPGHYILQRIQEIQERDNGVTEKLLQDLRVEWAEQQFDKVRVKRRSFHER